MSEFPLDDVVGHLFYYWGRTNFEVSANAGERYGRELAVQNNPVNL